MPPNPQIPETGDDNTGLLRRNEGRQDIAAEKGAASVLAVYLLRRMHCC